MPNDGVEQTSAEQAFFDGLRKSASPEEHRLVDERALERQPFASQGSRDEVAPAIDPADVIEKEAEPLGPAAIYLRADVAPMLYAKHLTSKYGSDWLQWSEPETIWRTIERDHDLPEESVHQVARDKISAMRSLVQQDAIWEIHDVFENAVLAFNDELSTWDTIEGIEPEQLSYFMRSARRLVTLPQPGYDVRKYVAGMLGEAGWILVPHGCAVFQEDLDDYCLQTMDPGRHAQLKQAIKTKLGTQLRDDDEDVTEVAAARHEKVLLYLRVLQERERKHAQRFGIT